MRELIGARLKEERERLGYNQIDFAAVGGASNRSQVDWEKGKQVPNAEFLASVATIGVDVQYVLTGVPSPSALTQDEKELLSSYRGLDIRGKAGLLGMIEGMENAETKPLLTSLQRKSIDTKVLQVASNNGMQKMEVYHIIFADFGVASIADLSRDRYAEVMKLLDQSLAETSPTIEEPAQQTTTGPKTSVVFHGKIGQQITGDITAPQTFNFGGRKKKSKEEK